MALGIPTTNNRATSIPTTTKPKPTLSGFNTTQHAGQLNSMLDSSPYMQGGGGGYPTTGPSSYGGAFQTGLGFYNSLASGDYAKIAQAQDQARFGIGINEAGLATDSGILRAGYGDNMAKLGLNNQQLGIDRNKLLAQIGNLKKDHGFADERFGLTNRGLDIDERGFKQGAEINTRNTKSSAIPRDASTSEFTRLKLGDIQDELANQLGGVGIGRQGADLSRREKKAQLDQEKVNNDAALKTLDLKAKEAGLDAGIYQRKLEEGLQALNLNSQLGVKELMMALESGDIDKMMLATRILADAEKAVPYFQQNPTSAYRPPQPKATVERIGTHGLRVE